METHACTPCSKPGKQCAIEAAVTLGHTTGIQVSGAMHNKNGAPQQQPGLAEVAAKGYACIQGLCLMQQENPSSIQQRII